jgi:hypothetical protein
MERQPGPGRLKLTEAGRLEYSMHFPARVPAKKSAPEWPLPLFKNLKKEFTPAIFAPQVWKLWKLPDSRS